jgi:hypothetical protein
MGLEEIIKIWKTNNVREAILTFDCGGDSMGDTSWELDISEGVISETDKETIISFFDDEVYRRVDFYVNSDGHYIGENGVVVVNLNDDEDDFEYSKDATSEWSENITNTLTIELTDEEFEFVSSKVDSINGGADDITNINYKVDFIITNDLKVLIGNLEEKIGNIANDFIPEGVDNLDDWYNFETLEEDFLISEEKKLVIEIRNQYTSYGDSNW